MEESILQFDQASQTCTTILERIHSTYMRILERDKNQLLKHLFYYSVRDAIKLCLTSRVFTAE